MANPIQRLVSKKKRRYQLSGFDLDLTFITNNIIAMGFPAEKIEGFYRNHIDDVASFLETHFPMRYFVFNLCSERDYPTIKFQNRVKKIPFDDHNPPKFTQIGSFCEAAKGWLDRGDENVIAVHCKAGKGRTGVMICCYLLHDNIEVTDAQSALQFYDEKRTSNKKGVTIPSQRRYVHYYGHYLHLRRLSENMAYTELSLYLTAIHLEGIQNSTGIGGCTTVYFTVHEYTSKLLTSNIYDLRRSGLEVVLDLDNPAAVQGDVKVEFFSKTPLGKERLFHCWFNTFFVIHSPPRPGENELPAAGLTRSCLPDEAVAAAGGSGFNLNNGQPEGEEGAAIVNVSTTSTKSGQVGDGFGHHLTLTFQQPELDRANKDKTHSKFPVGFQVTLHFICKGCHQCAAPNSRLASRPNGAIGRGLLHRGASLATPRPSFSSSSASLGRSLLSTSPCSSAAASAPVAMSSSFHAPSSVAASSLRAHPPTRRAVSSASQRAGPPPGLVTDDGSGAGGGSERRTRDRRPGQGTNNLLVPLGAAHDIVDSDANDDHLSETDPEDEEPWTSQPSFL